MLMFACDSSEISLNSSYLVAFAIHLVAPVKFQVFALELSKLRLVRIQHLHGIAMGKLKSLLLYCDCWNFNTLN